MRKMGRVQRASQKSRMRRIVDVVGKDVNSQLRIYSANHNRFNRFNRYRDTELLHTKSSLSYPVQSHTMDFSKRLDTLTWHWEYTTKHSLNECSMSHRP